ncbi:aldo/keto reductase [bacterium]|nr:aldo/keto reductase [bacterium]
MNRRIFMIGAAGIAAGFAGGALPMPLFAAEGGTMRKRKIPASGEEIPVIGLGSSITFDVGGGAGEREPIREVLRRFFAAGGRVIDSSPMYGRSEEVIGDLVAPMGVDAFLATKVWTRGKKDGEEQMAQSMRRLHTEKLDLMQVHNLVDWKTQLATMRAWRDEGKIRYLGITHHALGEFDEMEKILRAEKLDFVQLPYSVEVRKAEERLLPAAADTNTAVLIMRPFEKGGMFRKVKGKPIPAWAAEQGFEHWSQLFLAFILANPHVTCAIPATSKPHHLSENVKAGIGPELDAAGCKKLLAEL